MPATGNLVRNIGMMSGGAALAQLIPLAAMPLISRLYTPADFGVLASILAAATILSPLATGRYELAIVLPPEDGTAEAIADQDSTITQ